MQKVKIIIIAIVSLIVGAALMFIAKESLNTQELRTAEEHTTDSLSFYPNDKEDGVWASLDYQAFTWVPLTPTSYISNVWEPTGETLYSSFHPVNEVVRVLVPIRASVRNARIVPNAVPSSEGSFCGATAFWQGFAFGENAVEAETTGIAYNTVDIYNGIDLIWLVVDLHAGDNNTCNISEMLNRLRPVINIQDPSELSLEGWISNTEAQESND